MIFKQLFLGLVMALVASVAASDPYEVQSITNNDLVGSVERIDVVIYELAQSESADAGGAAQFDRTRIDAYNHVLDAQMTYVHGISGQVDLPYTYPTWYDIQYISNTLEVQVRNKGMRDLIRLYMQLMEQLSKSASANSSNGINDHDYGRYVLIRTKIDDFLVNYIDQTSPIDLPLYNTPGNVTNPSMVVTAEDRQRLGPLAVPRLAPTN